MRLLKLSSHRSHQGAPRNNESKSPQVHQKKKFYPQLQMKEVRAEMIAIKIKRKNLQ